jgi:glycine/D-amino acid oxidase-like deaminating enzyme
MLQLPNESKSYWRDSYTQSLYTPLTDDVAFDVAIVGAGITGLSSAYLLKQSGYTVAVLEKSTVGGGTSGRTTGKVTSQHNLIYQDLQKRLGTKKARMYGEANQSAVEQVNTIIAQEKIDCNWRHDDNYVFTTEPKQVNTFQQEAKVAVELGLPASFTTTTPLPFGVVAAVKFTGQGKINSQKYLLGLAKAIHGNGSYVFEHSNVSRIKDGNPGYVKANGSKVTAKHIIVATNVPTLPLAARGGYCLFEYPRVSYIVTARVLKRLTGMYISPDNEHYSILPVDPHTIFIGGEGHLSVAHVNTKTKYQRLANYAEEKFGATEITHSWSDRDYLAYDDVPLIGKLYPWSRNLYVATAFRKWGLSNGTVAAMILRDMISGQPNPWQDTFTTQRLKPILSFPRAAFKEIIGRS